MFSARFDGGRRFWSKVSHVEARASQSSKDIGSRTFGILVAVALRVWEGEFSVRLELDRQTVDITHLDNASLRIHSTSLFSFAMLVLICSCLPVEAIQPLKLGALSAVRDHIYILKGSQGLR